MVACSLLGSVVSMIDSIFSNSNYQASKRLLDAAVLRNEALAANIANVETPGYKRTDVVRSFAEEFAKHLREGTLDQAPQPALEQDPNALSVRKDGNNVQLDKELLAMSKNSAEYELLTEFVSGSIKQLRHAITGRPV